jgi:hypothetical protein
MPIREILDSPAEFVVMASAAKQSIFAENFKQDGLLRRLRRLAMTPLNRSVFSRVGIRSRFLKKAAGRPGAKPF